MHEVINVYNIGFSFIKITLYKLSMLEKKIPRTIFGLNNKKDQINVKYRLLHNEKLYDLYFSFIVATKVVTCWK
jgi:hypothetical protein